MTAPLPDAVGVASRLRDMSSWAVWVRESDKAGSLLDEAATLIQSQAARIAELEDQNRDLKAIPWPRAYIMSRRSEWDRLLRETYGYIHTCRGKCGSDMSGRDHALTALKEARSLLSEEGRGDYAASGSVPSRGSDAPAAPGEVGP